jgi:hypothetical protein
MVKKFIVNPSQIKNKADITMFKITKRGGFTQTGKIIRNNNKAVPLNPNASLNNPKSGNFATKRRNFK